MNHKNSDFYSKIHKFTKKQINESLLDACIDGDLDKVKFLLTSPELRHNADIHYKEDKPLHQACEHNQLHIIQYLLSSPELKEHSDIHSKNDWTLNIACNEGHFEIVRYLLTSPDLKEHSNIKRHSLEYAIQMGNIDIVDYLLNSPDLKEPVNIHIHEDSIFIKACEFGDMKTLQYLIYDLNIDRTDDINKYLEDPNGNLVNEAKNMFELRELNKQLNNSLPDNNEITKKPKL
jgi:ankyrin repeat protein